MERRWLNRLLFRLLKNWILTRMALYSLVSLLPLDYRDKRIRIKWNCSKPLISLTKIKMEKYLSRKLRKYWLGSLKEVDLQRMTLKKLYSKLMKMEINKLTLMSSSNVLMKSMSRSVKRMEGKKIKRRNEWKMYLQSVVF